MVTSGNVSEPQGILKSETLLDVTTFFDFNKFSLDHEDPCVKITITYLSRISFSVSPLPSFLDKKEVVAMYNEGRYRKVKSNRKEK